MGWWSAEIFGGDTPLDCQGHIETVLEMKRDYSAEYPTDIEAIREEVLTHGFDRKKFQKNIGVIFASAPKHQPKHIYYQVVGALCANMGIKINDFQKMMVIDAIDHEVCTELNGEDGGWEDDRRKTLTELHNAMLTYTSKGHDWNKMDEARAQELRKHRIQMNEMVRKHRVKEAEEKRIADIIALGDCQNI